MKYIIITSLVFMSVACTSKKKSYCDLVEKPVSIEEPATENPAD